MSDVLTAAVTPEGLHQDRPIIGFSPWVYPIAAEWTALTALLRWANIRSILFHMTPKGYSREIDKYTEPRQLAGRVPKGVPHDEHFEALRVGMLWAHQQGASVHFVSARPQTPTGLTGKAYSAPCGYPAQPFNVCAYASYLAELLRYMKNEEGIPIHVLHVIDEPRWVYRHLYEFFELKFEELWDMWPDGWANVYPALDAHMRARGCRAGTNINILSDSRSSATKNGVVFDDVQWLLSHPHVTNAAQGLGIVAYHGDPPAMLTLIQKLRASMAAPGAVERRIFFKDIGGLRQKPDDPMFSARQQYDYGLDALAKILIAAREGSDFYGQYFWIRPHTDPPTSPEYACEFDPARNTFIARHTLHTFALFTRTQERGAIRLNATTGLPSHAVFLALESLRGTVDAFRSYYFVNFGSTPVQVDFQPGRANALQRFSVDFAVNRGLTIQLASQPLQNGRARFTLAARSSAVLSERPMLAPLNWTPTV